MTTLKIVLLTSLLLLTWSHLTPPAKAQDGDAWQTYTNANCINDLAAEGDDVWAATCGGVVRWSRTDGSYIKYTTADGLAHSNVQAIAIDAAGQKWFGTSGGLSKFDGQSWITYTTADGLAHDEVQAVAVDGENRVWIGTAEGLTIFDGQSWTTYTADNGLTNPSIYKIAIDQAGHAWLAVSAYQTNPGGVIEFDGQTWTTYTIADGLVSQFISALALDAAGQLWVATDQGLSQFDGQQWTTYTTATGLAYDNVYDLFIDEQDHVWAATTDWSESVVSEFDGQTWTPHARLDTQTADFPQTMTIDPAGHVWLGTLSDLREFAGQDWLTYTTSDGPVSNQARVIEVDQAGNVWVGTDKGLSMFDGQTWTAYTTVLDPHYREINALAIDNAGQIWAGTENGARVFDGQTWTTYHLFPGLSNDQVNNIIVDKAGHVWLATYNGVGRFDGQTWSYYNNENGLVYGDVTALGVDEAGYILVGTEYKEYTNHGWTVSHVEQAVSVFDGQHWTSYSTENDLTGQAISIDQIEDKWVATNMGVQHFAPWFTYTTPDGLRDHYIKAMAIDQNDQRWLITRDGAVKIDQASPLIEDRLANPFVQAIDQAGHFWRGNVEIDGCTQNTYTTAAGLAGNDVNDIAIDDQGFKWFATAFGVSRFDDSASVVDTSGDAAGNLTVRQLLAGPGQPGRLYALTDEATTGQLLISDDFGQTWSPFPGGLPIKPACIHKLNLDYAADGVIYAGTCQGLYRWAEGEWALISEQETGGVAVPFGQPETLWATQPFGPTDVPVRRSDNVGASWQPASRFLDQANGVAEIAIDPLEAGKLYATIWPEYSGSLLRRGTADNGQWETMPAPPADGPIETSMTMDGASGALYVTTNTGSGQLWRSCNPRVPDVNAVQWEVLYDFGDEVQVQLLASGWSPYGLALYANLKGTAQEAEPVFHRSLDGGQTWQPLPIKF